MGDCRQRPQHRPADTAGRSAGSHSDGTADVQAHGTGQRPERRPGGTSGENGCLLLGQTAPSLSEKQEMGTDLYPLPADCLPGIMAFLQSREHHGGTERIHGTGRHIRALFLLFRKGKTACLL